MIRGLGGYRRRYRVNSVIEEVVGVMFCRGIGVVLCATTELAFSASSSDYCRVFPRAPRPALISYRGEPPDRRSREPRKNRALCRNGGTETSERAAGSARECPRGRRDAALDQRGVHLVPVERTVTSGRRPFRGSAGTVISGRTGSGDSAVAPVRSRCRDSTTARQRGHVVGRSSCQSRPQSRWASHWSCLRIFLPPGPAALILCALILLLPPSRPGGRGMTLWQLTARPCKSGFLPETAEQLPRSPVLRSTGVAAGAHASRAAGCWGLDTCRMSAGRCGAPPMSLDERCSVALRRLVSGRCRIPYVGRAASVR